MTLTTRARRLRVALLLPLLALLAACGKFDGTVEVRDANTLYLTLMVGVDKSAGPGSGITSSKALCDELTADDTGLGSGSDSVEPRDDGAMYTCTISGPAYRSDFGRDIQLSEDDGDYHLLVTPRAIGLTEVRSSVMKEIDFRLAVTLPGKVTSAKGGQVDGDTVTYTDAQQFAKDGIDVRSHDTSPALVRTLVAAGIGLGLLALVISGAVAIVLMRRRDRAAPAPVPQGVSPFDTASGATAPSPAWAAPGPTPPVQPGSHRAAEESAPRQRQPWDHPDQWT